MSWTLADLDKLKKARATGARRIRYEDRDVTLNSPEEMAALQREMEQELGLTPANKATQIRVAYDRGLQ